MMRVEIIDLKSIKQSLDIDTRIALGYMSRFLKSGYVDTPIIVDRVTNVALFGQEVLEALELLNAKRAPVINIEAASTVSIFSETGKKLPVEKLIEAGLRGLRIPYGSIRVNLNFRLPKVRISLDELGVWESHTKRDMRVYYSTLELLYMGWPTPLVRLNSLSSESREVWAKLEGFNPFSNSVKDRIGWSMIVSAIERGYVGNAFYEATSTNTGIALTAIANVLNKKVRLYIPQSIQKVSDIFLKVMGAEVIRMPVNLTVESIEEVDKAAKLEGAVHLNQFENDANLKVHIKYTAREIDEQLVSIGLKPTHIIGGLGTSGHMSAISFYFKSRYGNEVKVYGVQPMPNEIIPGIRRIETGMKWCHWFQFDKIIDVTRDEAIESVIEIARKEGILVGLSSGAVVAAFKKIAKDSGVYVLVFPDMGYKYAEQLEEYMHKKLILDKE